VGGASPFHEGEQRVQSRLGVRESIEPWARKVVRRFLPEEHRAFYAGLPFLVAAARDGAGRPWATVLSGEPGFAFSPDPRSLRIVALPSPGDALGGAFAAGDDVGLLGIELQSRRRNRVNGRIRVRDPGGLELAVEQSFGNCPQYIIERSWRRVSTGPRPRAHRSVSLSRDGRRLVERADTFFVATGHRESGRENEAFGMDASHRGGSPGFVEVRGPRRLVFPDYAGNNHFNTLGNLLLDPRIGLLFVDFERGDLLQLSGRAEIDWDPPAVARVPGARRLVHVVIEDAIELAGALPLRFDAAGEAVRELRVVEKRRESRDVTSFVFEARDGGALPGFAAGQYLPVELAIPGEAAPVIRTYSLSGAPADPRYRISVKRQPRGLASRHLHDRVEVGDLVRARAPRGEFALHPSGAQPVVLASAGVGATPLVSMLHVLARDLARPVWFVHGARDGRHHPFRHELERLARTAPKLGLHVAYSRPQPMDAAGRDYHSEGRVDAALLEKLLPGLAADFYLCGPTGFMADLSRQLEARGVPGERIHTESFGPAASRGGEQAWATGRRGEVMSWPPSRPRLRSRRPGGGSGRGSSRCRYAESAT
jgi:ferredoxin-NADP reductase/predicted pyridoxine 5'-phosphate oxidase superfamily flavin-nucleotide-binding protein